jgi:hypothetical protein
VIYAILLPALFVVFAAEWFFFAVADGSDAIGGNSRLLQASLYGVCATGSESDVVFLGAAVVAVAFD